MCFAAALRPDDAGHYHSAKDKPLDAPIVNGRVRAA